MENIAKQTFAKRLRSMLKVDGIRMFTTPLVYIMAGVSLAIPILILVMTTMMGGDGEETAGAFANVWQSIGSTSDAGMSMDIIGMCNINLLFFLVAVFVCLYVADEFRSGYAKNLFTARVKKSDYVISKSLFGYIGGVIMVVCYFAGAMIGGAIAGLPFDTAGFGAGGVVACLFSKIFLIAVFVGIALLLSVVAKQKLWISILGSLAAGMLLFMMIPIAAPLDGGVFNVLLCFVGGALFAVGLGAASGSVLKRTNIL